MDLNKDPRALLLDLTVPTVIAKELLINLIINQGPQDQAGRLFEKDGIKLEEVKEIRIEHCNILHIGGLWSMTNLTKLSLCNNVIEKIENLKQLVNLKELDLSFNRIEKVENINYLVNLEILSLYSNKISELGGMHGLDKLQIFSIGKNLLDDWNHVLYLRKFKSLRSLNTSENPCTEQDGYLDYVIAFIPQLVYLAYKMISAEERKNATEKNHREITALEEVELVEEQKLEAKRSYEKYFISLSSAYVENLNEDYFFQELFENDTEGKLFLEANPDVENLNNSYKETFCEICSELVNFGLSEHERRSKEMKLFMDTVDQGKTDVAEIARKSIDSTIEEKDQFFVSLTTTLTNLIEQPDENILTTAMEDAERLTKDIINIAKKSWSDCIKREIALHQQVLDATDTFKANMIDVINHFTETSRGYFTQMRSAETDYSSVLNKVMTAFMSNFEDDMPAHLAELCGDKDILNNNISASHDVHLQVIDTREDTLINRINDWFRDLIERLVREENQRYKSRVLEMSHLLDFQNQDFEHLMLKRHANIDTICYRIVQLFNEDEQTNFVFCNEQTVE